MYVHIYYFKIKDIWVLAWKTSCLNLFEGFAGLRKRNKIRPKKVDFYCKYAFTLEAWPWVWAWVHKCDQKLPSNKYVRKVALRIEIELNNYSSTSVHFHFPLKKRVLFCIFVFIILLLLSRYWCQFDGYHVPRRIPWQNQTSTRFR